MRGEKGRLNLLFVNCALSTLCEFELDVLLALEQRSCGCAAMFGWA